MEQGILLQSKDINPHAAILYVLQRETILCLSLLACFILATGIVDLQDM